MGMATVSFEADKSGFSDALKVRVSAHFKDREISTKATWRGWIKAWFFILGSVACYVALVFGSWPLPVLLGLCVLMAIFIAGVGFNVMHDAVHGNFGKKKWVNSLMSYSMELFGASSDMYRIKHATMHHTYTNVANEDPDIYESPIIRMAPHQRHMWIHRFQPIYATFLYGLLCFAWIYHGDFDRAYRKRVCSLKMKPLTGGDYFKLFFFKGWHFFAGLILPTFFNPFLSVLACYVLVMVITGVILSIVFQLAHIHERALHPLPDSVTGRISGGWERHQLLTSADFATRNRFVCFYLGGLNFQAIHHLYAGIHHDHYPAIQPIIVKTCEEFGVPYVEFRSVTAAVVSHYRELYRLRLPNPVEVAFQRTDVSLPESASIS